MKAFVLAAGKGSRLGELSEHLPKPMLRIGGVPVLERNLRWLARHGVREVAINLHHLGDVIEKHCGDGSQWGLKIVYSREPQLLGTAGGVKRMQEFLADAPFLVVYGDNLFDFDLGKLVRVHEQGHVIATLALFSVDQHQHTGIAGGRVEVDRSGRVLRFLEGTTDTSLRLVNAGCYVLDPAVLQHIPAGQPYDFGKELFPKLLRQHGILLGHVIDGRCLGLDTPDALAKARSFYPEGEGVRG